VADGGIVDLGAVTLRGPPGWARRPDRDSGLPMEEVEVRIYSVEKLARGWTPESGPAGNPLLPG